MFLPITSLLVTLLISYFHKNELKEQKLEEVLLILTLLGINLLMEYKMGPEFIIVIGFIGLLLIDNKTHTLKELLFYYLGVSLILCIYLFKHKYMRIILVLIILFTIISLEMINNKKEKQNQNVEDSFLKGLLLLTFLLYWVEKCTNIKPRYIKLWLRK